MTSKDFASFIERLAAIPGVKVEVRIVATIATVNT